MDVCIYKELKYFYLLYFIIYKVFFILKVWLSEELFHIHEVHYLL